MTALDQFLARHSRTPFEWGKHDCVFFAAAWAKQKCGIDFLANKPVWASKREALKLVSELGGLRKILGDTLGAEIDNPVDGDIGLLPSILGGVCIVCGPYVIGPGAVSGLYFAPRTESIAFWKLP